MAVLPANRVNIEVTADNKAGVVIRQVEGDLKGLERQQRATAAATKDADGNLRQWKEQLIGGIGAITMSVMALQRLARAWGNQEDLKNFTATFKSLQDVVRNDTDSFVNVAIRGWTDLAGAIRDTVLARQEEQAARQKADTGMGAGGDIVRRQEEIAQLQGRINAMSPQQKAGEWGDDKPLLARIKKLEDEVKGFQIGIRNAVEMAPDFVGPRSGIDPYDSPDAYRKLLIANGSIDYSKTGGDINTPELSDKANQYNMDFIASQFETERQIQRDHLAGMLAAQVQYGEETKRTRLAWGIELTAEQAAASETELGIARITAEQKRAVDDAAARQKVQDIKLAMAATLEVFPKFKALAAAQALMNTYESAVAAYKSMVGVPYVGPVLAVAAAANAVKMGMDNVKAILATHPGSSGGGGGAFSGGGGASSMSLPEPAAKPGTNITLQIKGDGGLLNQNSLATTIVEIMSETITATGGRVGGVKIVYST